MNVATIDDIFLQYQLTPDQSQLVQKLKLFLQSGNHNVFLLQGYAGTGKTFITKGLTQYFAAVGRDYVLAAPTGKAARVIASKTNSPAHTIHKTIYNIGDIKEYRDEIDGSETYKFYTNLSVNLYPADTVFIFDEASMISDKYNEAEFIRFGSGYLLRDIFKFVNLDCNDHRKKIIFIGDTAQLHPIGMNFSPALNMRYLEDKYMVSCDQYMLTDVVRQQRHSGILQNAITLRKSIEKQVFNELKIDSQFSDVDNVMYGDVVDGYLAACEHKVSDKCILIAGSNADVHGYNQEIRRKLLPGCGLEIVPGDKIIAVTNTNFYGIPISNGDFGFVGCVASCPEIRNITLKKKNKHTSTVEKINVELRFRLVNLEFRDENGNSRFFDALIIENLLYSDKPNLNSDENKALYVDFCMRHNKLPHDSKEFKDALRTDKYFNAMRVKFGYAITCHKAQGSEWQHVFVKCKGHNTSLCDEYFRWLYTAITRAKGNLHLIEPPHFKITSGLKQVGQMPIFTPQVEPESSASRSESLSAPQIFAHIEQPAADVTFNADSENSRTASTDSPIFDFIYAQVVDAIKGMPIEIVDVSHHQYQEAYSFMQNGEVARINIWYKSDGRISSVTPAKTTQFSTRLLSLLSKLKGAMPQSAHSKIAVSTVNPGQGITFSEEFLAEFYQDIKSKVEHYCIQIVDVKHMQFCERYTFRRNEQMAQIDFWYSKKKRFGKWQPVGLNNDAELVQSISEAIKSLV